MSAASRPGLAQRQDFRMGFSGLMVPGRTDYFVALNHDTAYSWIRMRAVESVSSQLDGIAHVVAVAAIPFAHVCRSVAVTIVGAERSMRAASVSVLLLH